VLARTFHHITWAIIGIVFIFIPATLFAATWSLSIVSGYYLPRLDELNHILNDENIELGPRNTEAKPTSYPVIYQGFSPSMPDMQPKAPKLGIQVQADFGPRYALVFGGTIGTLESFKRDIRDFFVGFWIPATRETRFSLTVNQFWFGAKRYWIASKKGRFYSELGILALTRVTLTTDVWLHVFAPEEGFDFYKVTETEARGSGFATYLGAGGEIYLKEWMSIGIDINYILGGVNRLKYTRYFTVDPLEKDIIKPGDEVRYTDLNTGRIVPLFIDLEGWDLKGFIRFYL